MPQAFLFYWCYAGCRVRQIARCNLSGPEHVTLRCRQVRKLPYTEESLVSLEAKLGGGKAWRNI